MGGLLKIYNGIKVRISYVNLLVLMHVIITAKRESSDK